MWGFAAVRSRSPGRTSTVAAATKFGSRRLLFSANFDTLFFRPNFFSFLPFRVYFSESRKYTKMASDKAPLPFGYTFMAGERNSNEPRP
jgi:hypothetical protein